MILFFTYRVRYFFQFSSLLILFTSLCSCASLSSSALRREVSGQGKITLNKENSFVAPNRFLAEESEKSKSLKGFLSVQGSPTELEFEDSFLFSPQLSLFYSDKSEMFLLKYISDDWIISGPFPFEAKEVEEEKDSAGLFSAGSSLLQDTPAKLDSTSGDKMPPNLELPKTDEVQKTNAEIGGSETGRNQAAQFEDLYHAVRFEGESYGFIAHWYTGDVSNQDRIKSINALTAEGVPAIGSSIRIPSYLLKKRDSPSEDDIKKFMMLNP